MESQIQWHGLDPKDALVTIFPEGERSVLTTEQIFKVIDENASTASILFLSGVQYYTGQAFDIKTITQHAQSKGIIVGWDFAHGVGNIMLDLHEWGVDFVCTPTQGCGNSTDAIRQHGARINTSAVGPAESRASSCTRNMLLQPGTD